MSKNKFSLRAFPLLKLRALRLLQLAPLSYPELADKLCVCRRYAEQVVQQLKVTGFIIHSRTEHRRKYFWTAAETDFLPTILTAAEKAEVEAMLAGPNQPLQTALYKMTQLLNA